MFYATEAERRYNELVLKVFPDLDTRPFHKWLRDNGHHPPMGNGSRIQRWYTRMLRAYQWEHTGVKANAAWTEEDAKRLRELIS